MRFFNPTIETLPLPQLRQLQSERLQKTVALLYEKVPFYRQKMDEAGIDPKSIRGVEDLHRLPLTHKSDLRDQYPFGLFALPEDQIARIHCSSGTTGKPTVVGYSQNDLRIFTEVVARSLVAAGCQPGMKLQNAYGYGLFTGGLGLHYGAEALSMTVVPVSGGMTDRQLMLLEDFRADAISCTPSYAQTLAEAVQKRGLQARIGHLKFAILGAEPWTESVRADVEAGLGVSATNIYGLSEIIGPGVSQEDFEEKGTGSYVWEDHFFPEIVDKDTGEPLPEGAHGVLVFTTLTKEAMPLLRYRTNDISSLSYQHSGKRTHIKMGPILGRADDMLIIRGVNVFPTQVEAILAHIAELSPHYQLRVSREGTMDAVEIHVEVAELVFQHSGLPRNTTNALEQHDFFRNLQGAFVQKIKDNIGISMRVVLCPPGAVPRSEGGKLSRVVDERGK